MNQLSNAGVYLLHISPAYEHARHYTGYADDLDRPIALHKAGKGARLTQVAVDAGCTLHVTRVWPGQGRDFERKLKRRKNAPRLCPWCNGALDFDLSDISEMEF